MCQNVCIFLAASGWACASMCPIVRSCVSELDEHQCSLLFFQLSHNSLFSGSGFCETRLIPAETSSHAASGLVRSSGLFFPSAMRKKKKVQYFNPPSLSHVRASICMSRSHVIIPFCSGCCHGVVPPLLASSLFQLHCTTYIAQRCMGVI